MNDHKCPICGKAGLSDFRKEIVICPACDTDLSAYVLINSRDSNTNIVWKILLGLSVIAILGLSYYSFMRKTSIVNDNNIELVLKDSINILRLQNYNLVDQLNKQTYLYKVRKGDSFNRISRLLYGSEKYGDEIAKANGMVKSSFIYPGIKLKMSQK